MTRAVDEWESVRYAERRLRRRLSPFPEPAGTVVSVVLALLVAAACSAVGALWPAGEPPELTDGTAVVLADGRLFVLDDGTLHPAANLASALLASDRLEHVESLDLGGHPIGVPRGIPGAITALPDPAGLLAADWQLCTGDDPAQTFTVGAAPYLPPPAGERTLLTDGTGLWLVIAGARTALEPGTADQNLGAAVTTSPTVVALLDESRTPVLPDAAGAPATGAPSAVVCAQSDPQAPLAQPSTAAAARAQPHAAPVNNGTAVVLPPDAGLLVRQGDGAGYWLLSYTAELAPIVDDAALTRLGYSPRQAVDLPEPILGLFVAGPELSIAAAATALDEPRT